MSLGRARQGGLRGVCGLVLFAGIASGINARDCFGQSTESPSRQNDREEDTSGRDADGPSESVAVDEEGPDSAVESARPGVVASPEAPRPIPQTQASGSWGTPSALNTLPTNSDFRIRPRATLRGDIGDGVGYEDGYLSLEDFVPLWQTPGEELVFVNLRSVNYNAFNLWEGQLGAGVRQLSDDLGVVLGANVFYDGRTTDTRFYNQVGFGLEALGSVWEARGNVYIPVGAQRFQGQGAAFANPVFVNQNIQIDRISHIESAMRGVDLEIGRQLPSFWDDLRTSAYVGCYHYSNDGIQSASGVRVRAESWFQENVSANLAFQNDAVFDTTVTGGLSLHYGGVPNGRRQTNQLAAKLGSRVVRDPNIVIQSKSSTTQELLTDSSTGNPIVVVHADSNATPGGDGSIDNPFDSLTDVQANSGAGDILFLHGGSTFTQESLNLQNGQRLLGEGVDHFITATQGTFLMPTATSSVVAPILLRTSGATNAVNLASDNEVSGLSYQRTGGTGGFIGATGAVGAFDINRNTTTGGLFAVGLVNVNGDGVISNNTFGAHTQNAISAIKTSGSLRLLIEDNQFNGGTAGVIFTQTGGNSFLGIRDNQFTSAVSVSDTMVGGTQTLQLLDNTGTGGFVLTRALGTFQVENSLGTNTPAPTTAGTIIFVPVGTAGF